MQHKENKTMLRGRVGLLGGAVVKNPLANVGDVGPVLAQEYHLEEGVATPPLFFQGNPMDRGACWATAHGVEESRTQLSRHARGKVKEVQFISV